MRIVWSEQHSVFTAEFSSDFHGDLDAVKNAGFRTHGAPEWLWFVPPPGIKQIDRLRDNKPKSGLTITELAFQKYQSIKQKQTEKDNLREQFKQARKQQKKTKPAVELSTEGMYFDELIQVWCYIVCPVGELPCTKYDQPAPKPVTERCLLCETPLYEVLGDKTFCMYCEKENEKTC